MEDIEVHSSFFALGGNSLRALMLANKLTEMLGRQISTAQVIQAPTIASLVGDGRQEEAHDLPSLPALNRSVDGAQIVATPHAISWNQSQLLTVHVADGTTAAAPKVVRLSREEYRRRRRRRE